MIVKYEGTVESVTDVEIVGNAQLRKYEVIIKNMYVKNQQPMYEYLAISVFEELHTGRNLNSWMKSFISKMVNVVISVKSATYTEKASGKIKYIHNVNLISIIEKPNTLHASMAKAQSEGKPLIDIDSPLPDTKPIETERPPEMIDNNQSEPFSETINPDDLPF